MQLNEYVVISLMKLYMNCGSVVDGRQVSDKFLKDVVSWTVMIRGYAWYGHSKEAYTLFCQMRLEAMEPGIITYMSILKVLDSPAALERGKQIHAHLTEVDVNLICT